MHATDADRLARLFVEFLESGTPSPNLFSPDVFCDFTMPKWRLQARGIDDVVQLRRAGHPGPGIIPRWHCDPTPNGFILEFEEEWDWNGTHWYSREMARLDVHDGRVTALSVYCTGDWDEALRARHRREVELLRA
jgi:hypothetical protein